MPTVTPLTYSILLALADGPRHGYGIIKEIEGRSAPSPVPSTGALYLALQRMEGEGLIQESANEPRHGAESRRRYWTLTDRGREVARQESRHLEALVAAARDKDLLAGDPA